MNEMTTPYGSSAGKGRMPGKDETILAQGITQRYGHVLSGHNDNILVVGGSGSGKTRSVVCPNILQATGSYVVSDPKGNLYGRYAGYLRARGYRVERLDFCEPLRSTVHYSFFRYLENETDILRVAHLLNASKQTGRNADQFWEFSCELLLEAMIAYLHEAEPAYQQNLSAVLELIRMGRRNGYDDGTNATLDSLMQDYRRSNPNSFAVKCYDDVALAPTRTWDSICVTATAKFGPYETRELTELMRTDTVHLEDLGTEPTAIFVVVSDTDRSVDTLANLFFSQAMQVLCRVADAREDGRLPVPVRFILDDFATNVRIEEFPRMIASIRSRGISAMLMIQSEAQLRSGYGEDDQTIIGNCDTYLYLGGNDIDTAEKVAKRCELELSDILHLPAHMMFLYRRGMMSLRAYSFDLAPYEAAQVAAVYDRMEEIREPQTIGEELAERQAMLEEFDVVEDDPDAWDDPDDMIDEEDLDEIECEADDADADAVENTGDAA